MGWGKYYYKMYVRINEGNDNWKVGVEILVYMDDMDSEFFVDVEL